ncbi:hypothetical protein GBAR_LOCUS14498 [Geodia barretti]|uniref:Uncharacterized protein n=1 Tax=Geodia barretti TaxID=519541 RepID=A0AA35S7U6_GEOBA|nr:hypothetical protein GBAR_LOCUS14498 [Geodia barretti]
MPCTCKSLCQYQWEPILNVSLVWAVSECMCVCAVCVCVYYFRKVWRKSDKSTRKLSSSKRPTERECQYSDGIEIAMEVTIAGLLGRVEMKWEESERRTHTLAQCLGRAGDLTDMNTASLLSPSAQLTKCREAVGEKEGEVKKVASEIEALQGTVAQLRRQISAAEERIPRLEEAKKTAVTARRYKEAGRLSSELKQLKTELEPQKTQLAEKEGEVGDVNKRLAGLSSELAGERVHLDQLERQEDLQHLRRLTSSLSRLQATKTSIPGSSSPPLEKVLVCWLQLYQLLAEGLCAKHDLDLADFTPHADTQPEEEEEGGEEEGEKLTVDTAPAGGGNMGGVPDVQKPPEVIVYYSGTSDKGPSEIRTTSLQRTLVYTQC